MLHGTYLLGASLKPSLRSKGIYVLAKNRFVEMCDETLHAHDGTTRQKFVADRSTSRRYDSLHEEADTRMHAKSFFEDGLAEIR